MFSKLYNTVCVLIVLYLHYFMIEYYQLKKGFTLAKDDDKKKTITISENTWKVLMQYKADTGKPLYKIVDDLVEDNLR